MLGSRWRSDKGVRLSRCVSMRCWVDGFVSTLSWKLVYSRCSRRREIASGSIDRSPRFFCTGRAGIAFIRSGRSLELIVSIL